MNSPTPSRGLRWSRMRRPCRHDEAALVANLNGDAAASIPDDPIPHRQRSRLSVHSSHRPAVAPRWKYPHPRTGLAQQGRYTLRHGRPPRNRGPARRHLGNLHPPCRRPARTRHPLPVSSATPTGSPHARLVQHRAGNALPRTSVRHAAPQATGPVRVYGLHKSTPALSLSPN